jgi:hypothetical protein
LSQAVLDSYIQEGKVTVSSTKIFNGINFHRDIGKYAFLNGCFYHSKGMADWVSLETTLTNLFKETHGL